jgi:hypothetical protein
MRKRLQTPTDRDARTIRIILVLVAAGWVSALMLMGVAAMFWDRQ